ncbi:MAG: ABC transporter permease subunit, partial [Burkholderiaceae bacterium]
MDIFLQQIFNGLVLGSVYAMVALGYTMVYGILQLINFAHGEVLMIGAMVSLLVVSVLQAAFPELGNIWLLLAAVVVAVVGGCGGAAVGVVFVSFCCSGCV